MKCPFLKETRVKFCQISPFRKMIVSDQGDTEVEKCSTSSWTTCPVARERMKGDTQLNQCPFLQESFVQYCSLSSVTKFIPYNEAPFSRCANTNHRYCEHYLSLENPESSEQVKPMDRREDEIDDNVKEYEVDGIRMPRKLHFSQNHMWMDESEDGICHIGVDAFLTSVLGPVDEVSFITTKGIGRPSAVLTVRGVDLEVVFPEQLLLTGLNTYLRASPERLTADPYGTGWLFEAQKPKQRKKDTPLLQGRAAVQWMKRETERLTYYVHNELQHSYLNGKVLMADGGICSDGFAAHLQRDQLLKLFHKFFSPYVSWRN
jgi:glycine cleavage system H protein